VTRPYGATGARHADVACLAKRGTVRKWSRRLNWQWKNWRACRKQEQIGLRLLSPVDKLRQLRADIDNSLRSLDAGEGQSLDVETFIQRFNARHG
jgi:hypothetical protein